MARSRALAFLVIISALLVFGNACQSDADAANSFRSGNYVDAQLDAALAARRDNTLAHAWLQYASLVVAGAGGVAVVFPPRLTRFQSRRDPD